MIFDSHIFLKFTCKSSSSNRPFSVSRWYAHIRTVVLHTLNRVQRGTRLCPYLTNCATLHLLLLPQFMESFVLLLLIYSSILYLSASSAAAAVSLALDKSIPAYYYHRIPTRSPCFLSAASQRSINDRVAIYCATVFCLWKMYVSIGSNPACVLAASADVYSHFPSSLRRGKRPVSRHATWSWKPHINALSVSMPPGPGKPPGPVWHQR